MKRIFAVLSALCMTAFCFAGCFEKKEDSALSDDSSVIEIMIPLEMPDINISIPEDYEETSTDSNDTVYVKDDASIIVNSDIFTDSYGTVSEYAAFALETYKTYSDSVEIIAQEQKTVAATDGELLEFIYSLNTENGVFSKYCMVAYFSDGEKMYLVTCKADTDTYESYREEFISVINSVSFK